jgi:hypothetical protein
MIYYLLGDSMASRMDRYKETDVPKARSDRNKSLYKKIEDLDSYTNIAGVATIDNKNEIDIEKVKALLKIKEPKEEIKEVVAEEEKEEIKRNYDIKDILSKMKNQEDDEIKNNRSLSEKQIKLLEKLNKRSNIKEELQEELDSLVKTMKMVSSDDDTDDVGLLDDLKSDTMIGDATSIKDIIEEEKKLIDADNTITIDKSFFTSSFGFTQRDFEELKDMNTKIKKDNKFIIILLIVLLILIIGIVLS